MKNILMIEVSPRGKDSASRVVSNKLAERLVDIYPGAKILRHDLAAEHLPHLDGTTLRAISTSDPVEEESLRASAHQSDQLTNELLESDLLVMATPMWNFGIPSALKAWIDLVVRPGRTFQYSDSGVLGLAKNKKATRRIKRESGSLVQLRHLAGGQNCRSLRPLFRTLTLESGITRHCPFSDSLARISGSPPASSRRGRAGWTKPRS
jgi:FMN-dependent NADH-azoreductase